MNRAFYIIGIVFSVIFFFVSAYYVGQTYNAYMDTFYSYSYDYYDSYSAYSSGSARADYTFEAALWSLFFFASFITIDLLGLIKVKTKTMKAMAIVGLSISGLFLIWNLGVMSSPASMSFDEVGGAWLFYCMIMLGFCIVGLVQSVRYNNILKNGGVTNVRNEEKDLLDS